jgi:chaperonin cofactor prefoldin
LVSNDLLFLRDNLTVFYLKEGLNRKVESLETVLRRINNQSKNLDENLDELNTNFVHIQNSLIEKFEKNISNILNLMGKTS